MVIETEGLGKRFGRYWANKDISISVGEGQVFALLGANGAGKSTLVKSLVGLSRPTEGSARLLGRPVGDKKARANMGFLPEGFRYHEWLTAGEVVDLHGKLYGMQGHRRSRRTPEVLKLVGLSASMDNRVRTFSKGMQQRLGLACALVNDPKVVFLDEPTSALDPIGRRDVREIILKLKDMGTTVFLNSHLLSEVEMVCDQVAFIRKGRIVMQGSLSDMLQAKMEVDLVFTGPKETIIPALAVLGEIGTGMGEMNTALVNHRPELNSYTTLHLKDEGLLSSIAPIILGAGGDILAITPKRRSLEDLFIELVKEG